MLDVYLRYTDLDFFGGAKVAEKKSTPLINVQSLRRLSGWWFGTFFK